MEFVGELSMDLWMLTAMQEMVVSAHI